MNTPTRFKSTFAGLLTSLSVLGFAAVLPNSAKAVLLTSTTTLPTMFSTNTAFYFGGSPTDPSLNDPTQYDIGVFTFANPNTVPSLVGLQISLSLNALDTQTGQPNGDANVIDLTLNGVDTGVALNGFGTSTSAQTITGLLNTSGILGNQLYTQFQSGGYVYAPLTLVNSNGTASTTGATHTHIGAGDQVIDSFNGYNNFNGIQGDSFDAPTYSPAVSTTAGQLVVGLAYVGPQFPSSGINGPGQSDQFFVYGGSASLEVSNNPIPFTPTQTLGFGLIALCLVLWQVPQAQAMMRRALVPAA